MTVRRNDFDVTNTVDTTDTGAVSEVVTRVYQDLYQSDAPASLPQAFADLGRLYRGEYPKFRECDTDYHDVQHVLDVTLALARMMDGCVRATSPRTIGSRFFLLGVITALFHDCGYIRMRRDTRHGNGAEYTAVHVSRGARFLESYLPAVGLPEDARVAAQLLHFTGYEMPAHRIEVPSPEYRLIGHMLGSADILAQMADRCYLEKCHDRLYPEFVRGGIARRRNKDGTEEIVFASAADLIFKTPGFYHGATTRLNGDLGGCHAYVTGHFGGENVYFDELEKNIGYARKIAADRDLSRLRRRPALTTDGAQRDDGRPDRGASVPDARKPGARGELLDATSR